MKIWIDFLDRGDTPSVEIDAETVPRIGEKVGVRLLAGMSGDTFALDYVVDVRHYLVPTHEIRVLTSSRP
jgi:hypothetical protein